MKNNSSGILIINKSNQILGCKANGRKDNLHDIPKGKIDEGEDPLDAAIRECFEETGLLFFEEELHYCGKFKYLKTKDLHVFIPINKIDIDLDKLECLPKLKSGKMFNEIVGYKLINFDDIDKSFYKSLAPIIKKLI